MSTHTLPGPATAGATLLRENAGWCWFQGPRAIVTRKGGVVFTSIVGVDGDHADAGDLWATCFDLQTGTVTHGLLHGRFEVDDHDVAGLLQRFDGRILAIYGKHSTDRLQRCRISSEPDRVDVWSPEQHFEHDDRYCYSNLCRLSEESGRIYNFSRTLGLNPNCTFSDDNGHTWHPGWRLFAQLLGELRNDPRYTGADGQRPYLRYATNHRDTIHFLASDDHPRAYDNSIYHGFYRGGALHDSSGRRLARVEPGMTQSALRASSFTELFRGSAEAVGWPVDLVLDPTGQPVAVFSVQMNDGAARGMPNTHSKGDDLRYWYARYDGTDWQVHEMGHAGTCLYPREADYTGLASIDPQRPHIVVISTNAHPVSGAPLVSGRDGQRHWELFRGRTDDGGATWNWEPITADSAADNLRPVIPENRDGDSHLLWCYGTIETYTRYRLDIYHLPERH